MLPLRRVQLPSYSPSRSVPDTLWSIAHWLCDPAAECR